MNFRIFKTGIIETSCRVETRIIFFSILLYRAELINLISSPLRMAADVGMFHCELLNEWFGSELLWLLSCLQELMEHDIEMCLRALLGMRE